MIVTEVEATAKWCPHTRKYHPNGSFNRTDNLVPGGSHCIGSKCMAWRWIKDELVEFVSQGKAIPGFESEYGYCGLSGQR